MLRIRSNQLSSMARRDFIERVDALIRANLPAEAVRRWDVPRIARHCVDTAELYALTTEQAIAAFVLHMILINPDFHRQPGLCAILKDQNSDDSARMERLLTDAAESDWEEAATMCDPAAYWLPFLNPTPPTPEHEPSTPRP